MCQELLDVLNNYDLFYLDNVSISSAESLSCAFEMFVPPPPPPNLMNDTDNSGESDLGEDDDDDDFSDIGIPDFSDSLNDHEKEKEDSNHFDTVIRKPAKNIVNTSGPKSDIEVPNIGEIKKEDNINNFGTIIRKPAINVNNSLAREPISYKTSDLTLPHIDKPKNLPLPNGTKIDIKQNLLVGELKGKLSRIDKIDENEPPQKEFNVVDSPINNFSRNIDDSPNIPRKDFNPPENGNLGLSATKTKPDFKPKTLFNQIGNELLDKNRKGLKETNNSIINSGNGHKKLDSSFEMKFLISNKDSLSEEKKLSNAPKKPFVEIDSGHCTARSLEMSDSEKYGEGSNPKSQQNSHAMKGNIVLHKTVSKTWSSCSSGVEDTDQNIDDNNDGDDNMSDDGFMESEIEKPKVNLRDLLKKMKSYDSDTDDETFDFKSGSQNDTVIRYS